MSGKRREMLPGGANASDEAVTPGSAAADRDSRRYPTCGGKKRQGEGLCTRPAGWGTQHPGLGRCKLHGGSTQTHLVAAQQEQAREVYGQIWKTDAEPVVDAVGALQRLAGRLEHAADALGSRLDVEDLDGPTGLAWSRVLRELRQALEGMERLNLGQKAVEVEAGRVRLVAAAVGRVFEVLDLAPEQRVRGTEVLLAELRARSAAALPEEVVDP
ncbi:hypothetical protein [Nocardioides sp. AX2bis]|uniref:hypothetical protein n=1 Tax=Nocardioides sp. AX2bis TaxID=2653157 RepID=UPI0012F34CAF|nr:hypothetical protein [Nocardioides sp. AX2bis]VXC49749.1 hypothetical protein NOCARDAX2BIS_710004 [Nocardioides sp. AX2bis]